MTSPEPIRTVHLTNAWHATSGGVRTFYLALLEDAERRGRSMTLVVPGQTDGCRRLGRYTRIYTMAAPCAPAFDRRYRVILPHRFATPIRTTLWRILEREQPDVVEVADKLSLCHVAGLIKRRRGARPTVVGLTHERLDDSLRAHLGLDAAAERLANAYLRLAYVRQFDAHLANSAYTAAELRAAVTARGPKSPAHWRLAQRIFVEPPGVDLDGFRPERRRAGVRADLMQWMNLPPSARLLCFAGRLSPEKHAQWLVPAVAQAIARGVPAGLVVAGDGPLAAAIAADARRRLPGRCAFVGHLRSRDALAELVASADAFVHPNPREPFGIAPLEAMASGTPVILPAAGGVLTYATADNAWLAAPRPAGLAAAILDWHDRPETARHRAANARETAKGFGWPQTAARYFDAYETIHRNRLTHWSRDESVDDRPTVDAWVEAPH